MLNKIKSYYFCKLLLSYISEGRKLKIIKYNKCLRNKIDISIINYKFYSNKYIIYEENGKGKEYDSDTGSLIFEGEYLNGERNGKGKEYDYDGKLIFEGEYLNGYQWKGKEYDKNGNIIREVLKQDGFIKEYYDDNEDRILFEGLYLNGERQGKGKEYYHNGNLLFEGEYLNGKRHGKGKEYDYNGNLLFEGEYFYDKEWDGKRYDSFKNIIYELKNGKGFIKEFDGGKLIFEGLYLNGERQGKGKEYDYYGNLLFEGEYLNGKRHGKGKEYDYKGNLIFEGEFLYDKRLKGTEYYPNNKLKSEGEYLYNNIWNGKGYDENGNIIYELNNGNGKIKEFNNKGKLIFEGEGEYISGQLTGKGKEYDFETGNLIFEGEYLYDIRNGKGKEYDNDGNLIFEGEYVDGQKKV